MVTSVGTRFATALARLDIRPLQTVVVNLPDLAQKKRPYEIASIISRTAAESVFLVFTGDVHPRRELNTTEQLVGGMRLISALEGAGLGVTVGFASSEFVLWKHAGASHCCTGKFFNLRRFTKSRFDEPNEGGGQLPYWFEESLVAFLRESDIIRLQKAALLGPASQANPYSQEILDLISRGEPWLAKSWRFYMYSFWDLEGRIIRGQTDIPQLLESAEKRWLETEDQKILMEEPRNNGDWIRSWRRAILEA